MHTVHTTVATTMPDGTMVTAEATVRSAGDPRRTALHAQVAAVRAAEDGLDTWSPAPPRHADPLTDPMPPRPPTYTRTATVGDETRIVPITDGRLPYVSPGR